MFGKLVRKCLGCFERSGVLIMPILGYITVGVLVSIPLWFFSWFAYTMYMDGEYGMYCAKCKQRHFGLCFNTERRNGDDTTQLEFAVNTLIMFMVMGVLVALLVKLLNYLTGF